MSWHEVPDEEKDVHHDVLSDRHDVGSGDFEDLNLMLNSGVEVDVIGPDTSGNTDLEVLRLLEELSGKVAGMEGSGDQDFRLKIMNVRRSDSATKFITHIGDVLLEEAVGTFLVVADEEFVPLRFEILTQAELILEGAKKAGFLFGCSTSAVENGKDLHDD